LNLTRKYNFSEQKKIFKLEKKLKILSFLLNGKMSLILSPVKKLKIMGHLTEEQGILF